MVNMMKSFMKVKIDFDGQTIVKTKVNEEKDLKDLLKIVKQKVS